MVDLIQKLRERQGDMSQAEFASELGITQAALSRIYSGDRNIGLRVARKIRKQYPDLAFDVASFLLADNMSIEHSKIPA